MLRYRLMPVPAGISLPMITFSFRPLSLSLRQLIAASVSTRVVSWNDAADSHESVASDAFVIPISTGRPAAGSPPSATTPRARPQRAGQELSAARVDDGHPPQHLPDDHLDVLVVNRHTLSAVHLLDLVDQVQLHLPRALDAQHLVRVGRALHQLVADLDVVAVAQQALGAV